MSQLLLFHILTLISCSQHTVTGRFTLLKLLWDIHTKQWTTCSLLVRSGQTNCVSFHSPHCSVWYDWARYTVVRII